MSEFIAMASPCQLLLEVCDAIEANSLLQKAVKEATRIEQKFSRYRNDNIVYQINNADGKPVEVDEETAHLLDYAQQCYLLSEGKFDISAGILRKAWCFDGSDKIPEQSKIQQLLAYVGWPKIDWNYPVIQLKPGMEIDFGGIGKEYAVDRTINLLRQFTDASILANYGGDIAVSGPLSRNRGWRVGMAHPELKNQTKKSESPGFALKRGAIATSGDSKRYLIKNGKRYGHILDPQSGWPVSNAPRSVTVVANTCTEAGIFATLAMLQGEQADAYLNAQGVVYWCEW